MLAMYVRAPNADQEEKDILSVQVEKDLTLLDQRF